MVILFYVNSLKKGKQNDQNFLGVDDSITQSETW